MARHGPTGVAASLMLAAVLAFPAPASAATYAIRLPASTGYGWPSLQIVVDDPNTSTAGPVVDVGATDFTIEAFIRGAASDNTYATVECGATSNWIYGNVVFDRHRVGGNETRSLGVAVAAGRAVFGVTGTDGTARTLCGSKTVVDGFWHHVAVQRRRSDGRMTIWVDGVLDASADGPDGDVSYPDDALNPLCGGAPCTQEHYLFVGGKKETQAASFVGSIDEIRISNVARYAAPFARPTRAHAADSNTAGLYHFNEGSGAVAGDSAGSSDATLSGGNAAARWIDASPFGALPGNGTPTAAASTTQAATARPSGSGGAGDATAAATATEPAPASAASAASSAEAAARIGRNWVGAKKGLPATLLAVAAILAALGFVVAMIVLGIRAAERS